MSGVLKSVGKIFAKIVKVAIKIAPYALAVAAVVFTGGAALGLLPTFAAAVGGVVSSLGLSAAVTGALTGAVTSAGFGAALGFVTGGKKGLQKGALMGALTGGVLGAINPATFGIVKSATGVVTTSHALASGAAQAAKAATNGIAPLDSGLLNVQPAASLPGGLTADSLPNFLPDATNAIQASAQQLGEVAQVGGEAARAAASSGIAPLAATQPLATLTAPTVADVAATLPSATVPATTSSGAGGFIQSLLGGQGGVGSNLTGLVGSVLQSIGKGDDYSKQAKAEVKAREKLGEWAYGGAYTGKDNPFGIPTQPYAVPQPRYYYDKNTNEVVDRQQEGA